MEKKLILLILDSEDDCVSTLKAVSDMYSTVPIMTRDNIITSLRVVAKKKWPTVDPGEIDTILSLSPADRAYKISKQKERLEESLKDVKAIDVEEVKKIVNEIDDETFYNNIILLLVTTGRRFIEIARVTPVPEKSPAGILITRVAKARKFVSKPFEVPLLFITYERMVKAFEIVRGVFSTIHTSNKELTNRYNRTLNGMVKDLFKTTVHGLRAIYANTAYSLLSTYKTDRHLYISKILGHHNISSSANYCKVIVPDSHIKIKNALEVLKSRGEAPTYRAIREEAKCGSRLIKSYFKSLK